MTSRAVGPVASLGKARLLGGAGIATLIFSMLVAFAGPAWGHEASGISANCDEVTVGWSGFPSGGVPVHIDANVGSVGTVSKDLTVDDHTAPTKLDISDYTRRLSSIERGIIQVDVTWDSQGPQDAYQIIPVWCGGRETTTTTSGGESAPLLPQSDGNDAAPRNSESVRSNNNTAPTSNVEAASRTASSTASTVASNSATSSTTTSTVVVSAAEATHAGPAASTSDGSLPFTGGPMIPLTLIGLSLLAMGAAVAYRTRDRRSPES